MLVIRLIFALALASAAEARAAEPVPRYPASAFGQLPFFEDPQLSPDGTRFVTKASVDGQQLLMIVPLRDGGRPKATPVKAQIGWFGWVNDDRFMVSLGADADIAEADHPFRVTRLVTLGKAGDNLVKMNWQRGAQLGDQVFGRTAAGEVLMSMRTTIFESEEGYWPAAMGVDAATGRVRTLVRGRPSVIDWYSDTAGAVRAGLSYLGGPNFARLIYRHDGQGEFKTIARADFNADQNLPTPLLIRPGSDVAVLDLETDGRGAIVDYDLAQGKRIATLWSNARYDADSIVTTRDRQTVLGVRYTADRARVDWLDPALATVQADLDKAVAPQFADIVSLSADAQTLLVLVSSPTRPGSFYAYDRSEGVLHRLANVNTQLATAQLAPMTAVHYAARDGLDIPAFLTLPLGRVPKGLPLIVMPHGGPAARDALDYDFWVQFLANRGYAVLQPNYRGSTGYGTKFIDAGDGEWGRKMQDDLTDGIRWLAAQGTIDAKRVCINGGSYGGYAALEGTVRDPKLYRCAISFAGVSDMKAMVAYDREFLFGKNYVRYHQKAAPDLDGVSPLRHVDAIETPILLVHGKKDQTVLFGQSQAMANALKRAGKTYEFVVQPEGDHHLSRQADRIQLLEVTEAFLAKYNPAD